MENILRIKMAQVVNNKELSLSQKVSKLLDLEIIANNYNLQDVKKVIRNTRVSLDAYATLKRI